MEGADGVGRQLSDVHQENLHHPVGLGPTVRPVLVTLDLHREKNMVTTGTICISSLTCLYIASSIQTGLVETIIYSASSLKTGLVDTVRSIQ